MTWLDEGAQVKVYTATNNEAFENGIRTDYPFQSGGTYNNPQGWSRYIANTADWTIANVTTASGRFSVSNAQAPAVHQSGRWGNPKTLSSQASKDVRC